MTESTPGRESHCRNNPKGHSTSIPTPLVSHTSVTLSLILCHTYSDWRESRNGNISNNETNNLIVFAIT